MCKQAPTHLREMMRVQVARQHLQGDGAARLLHDLRQLIRVRDVLAVYLFNNIPDVQQA